LFGKIANHRQEPWKRPLPEFITHLYVKRYGKEPNPRTIEELAVAEIAKRRAGIAMSTEPSPSVPSCPAWRWPIGEFAVS
jgi:hypothetical protein